MKLMLLPFLRAGSLLARITSCRIAQARDSYPYSVTTAAAEETAQTTMDSVISNTFYQSLPPLNQDGTTRRIFLLRHGETDWNKQGLMQGGGFDTELNEDGLQQAQQVAKLLAGIPFDVVASSHLERASQTAQIICSGITSSQTESKLKTSPVVRVINHKFGEMRFGEFEGTQIHGHDLSPEQEQARQRFHDWNQLVQQHADLKWPGGDGESTLDVQRRGVTGLNQLLRNFPHAQLFCIVAHGRFNKILISELLGMSSHDVFQQGNACVNVLDLDTRTGTYKAGILNYIPHTTTTKTAATETPN